MDGVETVSHIRDLKVKWAKSVPIVALTANAVSGTREMFLKNGFNDYLSKPIDTMKLNAILERWIPKEKQKIISAGAEMTSEESEAQYQKLLKVFRGDAAKAIETLQKTVAYGDISLFTTTAHAMKSALANIRENEHSLLAAELEDAGLRGNFDFIYENTPKLVVFLESFLEKTKPAHEPASTVTAEDTAFLKEQLAKIKIACENYDDTAAYEVFDILKTKQWKPETAETIEKIYNLLYMRSNFDGACVLIERLL
jgi:HPt (histidine-containing phosphotransfer) domain-containing protein